MLQNPIKASAIFAVVILTLAISIYPDIAKATKVTPPLTKCFIRVDNPHISKSIKRVRGFEAVKVNASSKCNQDMSNISLTVEIIKKGFLRDYLVERQTLVIPGVVDANFRVKNSKTWRRCETSKFSSYYGVAYAQGVVNGKTLKTRRVLSSETLSLPCGT
jgi:hypothetical protein